MTSSVDYSAFNHYLVSFPSDGVAHVQINRPDKLNAFYKPMWDQYGQLFDLLSTDPSIRAIVLSGAGERAFSTGLDLQKNTALFGEASSDSARVAWGLRKFIKDFQDSVASVERCDKPVICVLHGFSFGLAIDIACCADIRLAASSTKFSVKEVDIGIAADIGTLSRLPKIVGSFSWIKDITLTARVFGPEEALRQGFVSEVYESKEKAVDEALKLAKLIAGKSPIAVQSSKAILNYSLDHSIQDGLTYTQVWNSSAIQSQDPGEAIASTMEKRKPKFSKL